MTTPEPLDLEAIAAEFLQMCGPHDAGVIAECRCAERDYRPVMGQLVDEVTRLRTDLADAIYKRDEAQRQVAGYEREHPKLISSRRMVAEQRDKAEAERDGALAQLAANERAEDARLAIVEGELAAVLPLRKAAVAWRAMRANTPTKPKPEAAALIAAVDQMTGDADA